MGGRGKWWGLCVLEGRGVESSGVSVCQEVIESGGVGVFWEVCKVVEYVRWGRCG